MKDNKLILIILLILLIVWAFYSYNQEPSLPPPDRADIPCFERELITCWTDCGPTFLPNRTIYDPSESTQTRVGECGVVDECSPTATNYPYTEQQTCTLVQEPTGGPTPVDPVIEINGDVIGTMNNAIIMGCIDPVANNYNPNATVSDGTCTYNISTNDTSSFGCCNPMSPNFDPSCPSNSMCNCVAYLC